MRKIIFSSILLCGFSFAQDQVKPAKQETSNPAPKQGAFVKSSNFKEINERNQKRMLKTESAEKQPESAPKAIPASEQKAYPASFQRKSTPNSGK